MSITETPSTTLWSAAQGLNPQTASIEECVEAAALLLGKKEDATVVHAFRRYQSGLSPSLDRFTVWFDDPAESLRGIEQLMDVSGQIAPRALAEHLNACARRMDAAAKGTVPVPNARGEMPDSRPYIEQIGALQRGARVEGMVFGRMHHGLQRIA